MRSGPVLIAACLVHLVAGPSWAATPRQCRRCNTACGDAISECVTAAVTSCPAAPRGKARRCAARAKRRCRSLTRSRCIATCRRTGSPACGGATPGTCGPFTSSCTAVPLTPLVVTPPGSPARYEFIAHTAPPGPASCCVIDTCAGVTMFDASQGTVTATYQEIGSVDPMTHDGNVSTGLGINCPVEIPSDVYARSDTYRINFHPDLRFTLPPEPDWAAPYVVSAGDLSVSIDSANMHPSDVTNSFTPATWRLVDETASVDKVCAEQNLMQGHATVSFIKNDGTPCTVTIYAQGTRTVGAQ